MPETVIRSILMLQAIPRYPRRTTVRALRDALEREGYAVSERTIQRDLNKLSGSFPLMCEERQDSNAYEWSWEPHARGWELPAISPNTALAFLLADELGRVLMPNQLRRFLDEQRARARQTLADASSTPPGLKSWTERIAIVPREQPLIAAEPKEKVLAIVCDAMAGQRRFRGRYRSRDQGDRIKWYEINPLGLVLRNQVLYLVATLFDFEDVRLMSLHRFQDAEPLDREGWWPKGFRLDEAHLHELLDIQYGPPMKLVADFEDGAVYHLRETPLSRGQKLEDLEDGWVRVRATVRDTQQLRWWLLGFGEMVIVRKPVSLRREMAASARVMAERYSE